MVEQELLFGLRDNQLFGVPDEVAIPVEKTGFRVNPKVVVASSLVLATLLSGCGTVTDVVGGVAGGTVNTAGNFLAAIPGFVATEVGQFVTAGVASSVALSFGSGEGLGGVFSKRGLDRALVLPMVLFLFKNPDALWGIVNSGRAGTGAFGGLALQTLAHITKDGLTPGFFDMESIREKVVCMVLGGVTGFASEDAGNNLLAVAIPGFLTGAIAFGGMPQFGRGQH